VWVVPNVEPEQGIGSELLLTTVTKRLRPT
jgi:hypothetical protein